LTPSLHSVRAAGWWPALGWSLLSVFGLLLALAAGMNPAETPVTGSPPVRLIIGLPDWLKVTILGLFALSALLLLLGMFPAGIRRRRKKDDDEFEMVYETPRISPWSALVLIAMAALPLALVLYVIWSGWGLSGHGGAIPQAGAPAAAPGSLPPGQAIGAVARSPVWTGFIAVLGLAVGVGTLGLTLWVLLGDRLVRWWANPPVQSPADRRLIEAVEESLESLYGDPDRDPDPRRAIIRCYRRFELVLAGSGLPRAQWETPTEFMRKVFHHQRVPGPAVRVLTTLFEFSRFSQHPLGRTERDAALTSLAEIKAALEREESHAPVV